MDNEKEQIILILKALQLDLLLSKVKRTDLQQAGENELLLAPMVLFWVCKELVKETAEE